MFSMLNIYDNFVLNKLGAAEIGFTNLTLSKTNFEPNLDTLYKLDISNSNLLANKIRYFSNTRYCKLNSLHVG